MKLSSIEVSSRNMFQDQKNESSDDSRVRQSGFVADIASDFSNLSDQEQGWLIMLYNSRTKDTSPAADGISEGSICNDQQLGATVAVDHAKTSTTTSSGAGEVCTDLICNDSDQTRQLDLSADSVSLEQLDQDYLETQEDERANMGKIKLREVEIVPQKVANGNKSQVQHTDSSDD
ncbi:OLC1v1032334C1 [Oldenlandia corymbosa var. corymbosa]|uniref:OLC1v1032334C1 n=1 Tax=Oldenlandia corymbosa var. corymbosa TaxID=529605 RepID=A0AAV1CNN9_OLDCO|nr:OLC1v1032334C1 [Oldenlandia corymbosa var. corymbosa]